MWITLFRSIFLYILIIAAVRIMGKRQIGELQPSELVITILISEIAAIPMQDNGLPLFNSIIPIFILIAFEIILSVINMKSMKFRRVMEGNSVIIIRDGVIDQKALKKLRITTDDLTEGLRQKDVFDIQDVQYAIFETNGSLSVLLKPEKRNVTPGDLGLSPADNGLPCTVINDGVVMHDLLSECGLNENRLEKLLRKKNIDRRKVFLLIADRSGQATVIKKEDTP